MVRFDGVSTAEDKAARPPWNAEILLSLLPNTAEWHMIPSGYKAANLPGASAARENRTARTSVIPNPKEIAWLPFPYF